MDAIRTHPGDRSATEFRWPVRVYYEDTDAGGVVYYANYLKFCERARTEWLRELDYCQSDLARSAGLVFVVRSLQADYLAAAVLDDRLEVVSTIARLGGASIVFHQSVRRDQQALFEARITIACMDRIKQRAAPIPATMRTRLAAL